MNNCWKLSFYIHVSLVADLGCFQMTCHIALTFSAIYDFTLKCNFVHLDNY
jgi:hypothetical protein